MTDARTSTAGRASVEVLLTPDQRHAGLAADARRGLTSVPKVLSPMWFYDERGSQLFEEITHLPEYYLTRSEQRLLTRHAREIADATRAETLVELGSGSSEKTRLLLDALVAAGTLRRYTPLDVSEEALRSAIDQLATDYPTIELHGIVDDFHRHVAASAAGSARLVAFLGSTIGNLTANERAAFLGRLAETLGADDRVLVGVDLVKDPARLVAAYDDSRGVTAAFNRNALAVMSRTLDADFDPTQFDHVAIWNPESQWIEMHLRARADGVVRVKALGLDVRFARGETIRTEISAKFTIDGFVAELERAGLIAERTWFDGGEFLLALARSRALTG